MNIVIKDKNSEKIPVQLISFGDVFKWNGGFYIKAKNNKDINADYRCTILDILDGQLIFILQTELVIKVPHELIIKEK